MFLQGFQKAALYFAKTAVAQTKAQIKQDLHMIGRAVQAEAEKMIGTQQPSIGQFPAWAPLKQETIDRKARAGYSDPSAPLLASGRFRRSIGYKVEAGQYKVKIGTSVPYIVYTELGTGRMSPRPVFGPAALRVMPRLQPYLANSQAIALAGKNTVGIVSWPQAGALVGNTISL